MRTMRSTTANTEIRNTTRGPLPRVPFDAIAHAILPKGYQLSLVVCGDTLATRMNRTHRKKDYAPNVLSFPLGKREGEIFLNIRTAEREAKRYGIKTRAWTTLLFVHGCLHLKGMRHGEKMERLEKKLAKRFV